MTPSLQAPSHRQVNLKDEFKCPPLVVYYALTVDEEGRRRVSIRFGTEALIELRLLRSGLVHIKDRDKLASISRSIQVPVHVLAMAIRRHALTL